MASNTFVLIYGAKCKAVILGDVALALASACVSGAWMAHWDIRGESVLGVSAVAFCGPDAFLVGGAWFTLPHPLWLTRVCCAIQTHTSYLYVTHRPNLESEVAQPSRGVTHASYFSLLCVFIIQPRVHCHSHSPHLHPSLLLIIAFESRRRDQMSHFSFRRMCAFVKISAPLSRNYTKFSFVVVFERIAGAVDLVKKCTLLDLWCWIFLRLTPPVWWKTNSSCR